MVTTRSMWISLTAFSRHSYPLWHQRICVAWWTTTTASLASLGSPPSVAPTSLMVTRPNYATPSICMTAIRTASSPPWSSTWRWIASGWSAPLRSAATQSSLSTLAHTIVVLRDGVLPPLARRWLQSCCRWRGDEGGPLMRGKDPRERGGECEIERGGETSMVGGEGRWWDWWGGRAYLVWASPW